MIAARCTAGDERFLGDPDDLTPLRHLGVGRRVQRAGKDSPMASPCNDAGSRSSAGAKSGVVAGCDEAAQHGDAERRAKLASRVVHRRPDTRLATGTADMIEPVMVGMHIAMPAAITISTSTNWMYGC